ncbi:MAG TPA: glycosyltransferase family 2 protein [Paraburkholderia sp.]|jgi:glycosyltransferase involved in cell wall biosynthesis|nr:glycosyltransferase family 2 protein [Paraburkholderia sp.]
MAIPCRSETTQSARISICLPTCNRPDLIVACLDSCLAQTYDNIEILIGDDSKDARTQHLIATRYADEPRIHYTLNQPSLGQARNVASLFERASGERIVLIHDDDLLATDGIEKLASLWTRHPHLDVAFADQYEADHTGAIDVEASARLNADFRRTKDVEGLQPLPGRTGLIQMFPNNGWMASADLVKRIGYPEQHGMCCDYVFGTLLCLAAREVFYLHEYVSVYRKTQTSVSHSTRGTTGAAPMSAYAFVHALTLPPALEASRKLALRRLAPIVVSVYANNRQPLAGLKIALTHLFAYRYGFSTRLYYHLLMLARAAIALQRQAVVEAAPAVTVDAAVVTDRSELV